MDRLKPTGRDRILGTPVVRRSTFKSYQLYVLRARSNPNIVWRLRFDYQLDLESRTEYLMVIVKGLTVRTKDLPRTKISRFGCYRDLTSWKLAIYSFLDQRPFVWFQSIFHPLLGELCLPTRSTPIWWQFPSAMPFASSLASPASSASPTTSHKLV